MESKLDKDRLLFTDKVKTAGLTFDDANFKAEDGSGNLVGLAVKEAEIDSECVPLSQLKKVISHTSVKLELIPNEKRIVTNNNCLFSYICMNSSQALSTSENTAKIIVGNISRDEINASTKNSVKTITAWTASSESNGAIIFIPTFMLWTEGIGVSALQLNYLIYVPKNTQLTDSFEFVNIFCQLKSETFDYMSSGFVSKADCYTITDL